MYLYHNCIYMYYIKGTDTYLYKFFTVRHFDMHVTQSVFEIDPVGSVR